MTTYADLTDAQKDALRQFAGDANALVEEASDPSSPLNGLFDWTGDGADDDAARLEIAEGLIAESNKPAGGDDDDKAAAAVEGDNGDTENEAAPSGDDDKTAA